MAEQSSSPRGPLSLRLRNFRGLRDVDWSPDGVCLIAGPNGSGKTTLLEALLFLSDAFQSNLTTAVRRQRGAAALRHLHSSDTDAIELRLEVGDVRWELRVEVNGGAVGELPEEAVFKGATAAVRRAAYSAQWYLGDEVRGGDAQGRVCLRMAWEARPSPELKPIVDVLQGFRYHAGYALETLRQGGKGGESDAFLTPRGENLFVVLRNWKAAPRRFNDRFEWVLGKVKKAFPGVIEDIEFDPPLGEIVPARFYPPGERTGLPMSRAADGFLVGLLHLTAVAGAAPGAIVAIDEMENQLHPHAIRSILGAMRELAEERGLTVLLITHSPVLMNAFRDEPNRFFVTEISEKAQPTALDRLQDPEWLAHFSFGDLYDRLEIGAPPRAAE
jgi:predicted ATPase